MPTFRQRLDDWKWNFKEAGLERIWNELDEFADSAPAGSPATYGAADYVTHCTPDVTPRPIASGRSGAPQSGQFR